MTEKVAPPPRKVKHNAALKNIHTEQITKLQNKHQQECDLLEDIRTFSKQRSVIEKEYAQALLKLTSQLLKHEFSPSPELSNNEGGECKTATTVWRSILEETEKMAKARLAGSDAYVDRIHEPLKQVKNAKAQVLKKVIDHLTTLQNETSLCLREMIKSQKIYFVDEVLSYDARQKATDCENRLKRKSKGLFQSVGSMQRNCAKLNSRKDSCDVKSTASRNEYLLNIAAANVHQFRYYRTDLPDIMDLLDTDMYERLQEYFIVLGTTAVECSGIEQECFSTVLSQASLVSREYNQQCFLHDNSVFTDLPIYQYEPCHNDQIHLLSRDYNADLALEKEARKWASKMARENKTLAEKRKNLRGLEAGDSQTMETSTTDSKDTTSQDLESKLDELRESIRKSETSLMKAEARIELLREAEVDVDQWLTSAQMDLLSVGEDDISRTPSQVSLRTESSGVHSEDPELTYRNYDDDEDDFTDDTFEVSQNEHNTFVSSHRPYPITCTVLYEFQANNRDELGITTEETLELIADGDGDGWVKARNSQGVCGFIPENYVQIIDDTSLSSQTIEAYDASHTAQTNEAYQTHNRWSVSSGDYPAAEQVASPTSPSYSHDAPQSPLGNLSPPCTGEVPADVTSYTSSDYEIQESEEIFDLPPPAEGQWCRAIYDYEATNAEELTFFEGQLVKILRKDDNGVDDGWWEGEIGGRVGAFPSIVVEQISGCDVPENYGGIVTTTPDYLMPPPPVMVTLPTPDGEYLDDNYESTTDDVENMNGNTEYAMSEETSAPDALQYSHNDRQLQHQQSRTLPPPRIVIRPPNVRSTSTEV